MSPGEQQRTGGTHGLGMFSSGPLAVQGKERGHTICSKTDTPAAMARSQTISSLPTLCPHTSDSAHNPALLWPVRAPWLALHETSQCWPWHQCLFDTMNGQHCSTVPCPCHDLRSCQQLMPRSTTSLVVLSDHLSLYLCPCLSWNMSPGEQQRTGGIHGNVLLWASGCPRQSNRTHNVQHHSYLLHLGHVLDFPFHAISPGLLPLTLLTILLFFGQCWQSGSALHVTSQYWLDHQCL